MIALCREHHDEADQGLFSAGQLRSLKKAKRSTEDVKGSYPSWGKPNILVRIGGSYVGGSMVVLSVTGRPVVTLSRHEEGMLSLSFSLHDEQGRPVVIMEENVFEAYPQNIHDLEVAARKGSVRVWLTSSDIGLELKFDRITLDELDGILASDRSRSEKRSRRVIQEALDRLPPELSKLINKARSGRGIVPPCEGLPDHIAKAVLRRDPTGYGVKDWVLKNCLDDDKKIPFLNFEQMALYSHGERITVRNGIGGIDYCASFWSSGAFNLGCPCNACSSNSDTVSGSAFSEPS
jgi:hypothetical protein